MDKKMLLILIAALVFLVSAAVAVWYFFFRPAPVEETEGPSSSGGTGGGAGKPSSSPGGGGVTSPSQQGFRELSGYYVTDAAIYNIIVEFTGTTNFTLYGTSSSDGIYTYTRNSDSKITTDSDVSLTLNIDGTLNVDQPDGTLIQSLKKLSPSLQYLTDITGTYYSDTYYDIYVKFTGTHTGTKGSVSIKGPDRVTEQSFTYFRPKEDKLVMIINNVPRVVPIISLSPRITLDYDGGELKREVSTPSPVVNSAFNGSWGGPGGQIMIINTQDGYVQIESARLRFTAPSSNQLRIPTIRGVVGYITLTYSNTGGESITFTGHPTSSSPASSTPNPSLVFTRISSAPSP